jgi:hypothetical protein
MTANSEVEEGDPCPIEGCGGKMYFPKSKDCSCFISAPCGSCMDVVLTCNECGWEKGEDNEVTQTKTAIVQESH